MARPQQRKARKDYPDNGIKKGEDYWYVKIKLQRGGRVMRQKTPFRRSQLTTSEYLSQLYDWEDTKAALDDMDSAQDLADTIRALGEEQTEKRDNMPEGLQQGDTGQLLEARANGCETAAGEIEDIIARWESERDSFVPDDPEDGEEPEEFDASEFIEEVQNVEVSE